MRLSVKEEVKEYALRETEGLHDLNQAIAIFNLLRNVPCCSYSKYNFNAAIANNRHNNFYGFGKFILNEIINTIN